ncbi:MAG: Na/Pi cotransporter family protein [Proteobacteria bacterium]|nr:Na/Pi cotransporter family protein [Pseudomonadota bacterium]
MNYKLVIFNTIGGLGLFIFGMRMMSESLQYVAGDRLRKILETVSSNRIVACITGAVVTALIQSSSATTVMLVGFVNAGLMTMAQAVGVALGANVGTTMTAQLIAFKVTDAALPAIALGVGMRLFAKRQRMRNYGGVLLGFGLLFYGMVVMKLGVSPLKNSAVIVDFFTGFDPGSYGGLLLCVITGTVVTMILQSSSATVGLTMALAAQGLITFPGAVALVLGDNIGTTITAELSSIGTGVVAKRTARAHTMFNVIGVCYMILLFPLFIALVTWVTRTFMGLGPPDVIVGGENPNISRYIANAHTLFNVINATVFLVFLPLLLKAATWMTFSKEAEQDMDIFRTKYLDPQFLEVTPVALEQARLEVIRMADIAEDMMVGVIDSLEERKLKSLGRWRHLEDALDILQRKITNYLVMASQRDISLESSREVSSLMRMVNNIERIGDSVENIAELIEEMIENEIYLAEDGVRDYKEISSKVLEFYRYLLKNLKKGDQDIMEQSRKLEESIDYMREAMRGNYLARLRSGVCTLDPGLIFTDMLNHFEKIGDYCFNIAQAVAGVK